ncbi:protein-L-isoaspartate O-methyltransferase family protein [Halosimplex halophilum]|uniref:protein-L-isoaspartate O-methyltransferase family protein n=1 Tax=Halosimplex halophilum TaxID=2559572 RepID=UPI00107F9E24|nr:protein-L-isoaspartate O-methyltransferase [Halosimplex halophilum]
MDPAVVRDDMVDSLEHESKGCLRSEALSVAMREVPREAFVAEDRGAYADRPFERLGTRVLAPSTVARLLEALDVREGDSVLVVGAGVGYTAAVVAELAGAERVHAIDITRRLVVEARENLAEAGYEGVLVDRRDGADGLPEYAPFDRILLEAAAVSPPAALVDQLAEGGRLVMPHGAGEQHLAVVEGGEVVERLGGVAFRPMLVEGEQADTVERNRTRREDREFARRNAEGRTGWEQEWIDWDDAVGR